MKPLRSACPLILGLLLAWPAARAADPSQAESYALRLPLAVANTIGPYIVRNLG